MPTHSYSHDRVVLGRCLIEVRSLERIDREMCDWLHEKWAQESFNLVAVGEFKRGKSSVINALVGSPILPVGVVPLTSVVITIQYGVAPAAVVLHNNGERVDIPMEEVAQYATEKGNPKNIKGVRDVLLSFPSEWLKDGVRLIDTPGIGSVHAHNSDVTRQYLPRADAIIFVASVDQPMSLAELDLLKEVRPYAGKLFCVLNKTDYLSRAEVIESVEFARQAISGSLEGEATVYPISARLALEKKLGGARWDVPTTGFHAFEDSLRSFILREKSEVWTGSIARGLLRVLGDARLGADLELAALNAPLDQVEANLRAFRANKAQVLRARSDFEMLLRAQITELLKKEIEVRLERFKESEKARMSGWAKQCFQEVQSLPSRKIQALVEKRIIDEIRAAYERWLSDEEPQLAQSFDAICARFSSDMQELTDDLRRHTAALFGVAFEAQEGASLWSSERGFNYKFWYEPVGLRTLTSAFVLALPRGLARRLILARIRRQAVDLVETQAGRIRHDFEERLKKSRQQFTNQLLVRIDTGIAGIETAIENAIALRQRGEEEAARSRAQLERLGETTLHLEQRIRGLLSRPRANSAA